MKNLIKQLYNGQLCPVEKIIVTDPVHREIRQKIQEEWDKLDKELSNKRQREIMDDLYSTDTFMYGYENFEYGFRLGIQFMQEMWPEDRETKK